MTSLGQNGIFVHQKLSKRDRFLVEGLLYSFFAHNPLVFIKKHWSEQLERVGCYAYGPCGKGGAQQLLTTLGLPVGLLLTAYKMTSTFTNFRF